MRLCRCRCETSGQRLAMLEKMAGRDFLEEIHRKEKAVGSFGLSALSADALSKAIRIQIAQYVNITIKIKFLWRDTG